jgi:hypothetical protein
VFSVRTTISAGVSEVCRVIVSPFRDLIKPSTFVDWASDVQQNANTTARKKAILLITNHSFQRSPKTYGHHLSVCTGRNSSAARDTGIGITNASE